MATKRCSKCGREQDASQFNARNDRGGIGLTPWCKSCTAAKAKARYERIKQMFADGKIVVPPDKVCWKCGERKPSECFGKSKNHTDGLNPQCRDCGRQYAKQYAPIARRLDPSGRKANLWRAYRIRMDEYRARLEQQQYLCPICGLRVDERFTPQVDHDHYTGKVRDVLCRACNTKLAGFEKRIAQRPEFMRYLEKHNSGVLMAHRPKDTWGL